MSKKHPLLDHMVCSPQSIRSGAASMTIEELEVGLSRLGAQGRDHAFWDQNIFAFRQTVLTAISETSEMLTSARIQKSSWAELKKQSVLLQRYLDLADTYVSYRGLNSSGKTPLGH